MWRKSLGTASSKIGQVLLGRETFFHYNSKKAKRQRKGEDTFRYLAKYHKRTWRRQAWYDFERKFGIGDEFAEHNPIKIIWRSIPFFRLKEYPVKDKWGKYQSQVKLPKANSWNAGYYMWKYLGIFLDRFIYDIEMSNCGYRYLDGKPHDGYYHFDEDDPHYRPTEQIITNPNLDDEGSVFFCQYPNYLELKELQRRYHSFDPDEVYVSTMNGLIPWADFEKKYGKVNFKECTHGYQLAEKWIRDFAPYMLGMID